ncbi:MAG: DUF2007 domain-containing protein [Candidatus Cloacimonetes bacterium]|nr:DUF2007 domain-containing protein [Candidatus Cloacimonadota bacterium]
MEGDYVTVLQTMDLGLIAIAKSILEGSGIEYITLNENFGAIYNGFYSITGLIKIQVMGEQAEVATELLAELQANAAGHPRLND